MAPLMPLGAVSVCPAQTLPASCPHFSKHAGKGKQATETPASKRWQGHCHLPNGNLNLPRNLPGKLAAVPHVPTSACLSSSTLGNSRVAGIPLPGWAPNPLSQEQREERLEGALKVRRGGGNLRSAPPKKPQMHKQCQQTCFSNLVWLVGFN